MDLVTRLMRGILEKPQVSDPSPALEQLAGHDQALDLVGALVDLGDRRAAASFRS